jgi:hypothetical protein
MSLEYWIARSNRAMTPFSRGMTAEMNLTDVNEAGLDSGLAAYHF